MKLNYILLILCYSICKCCVAQQNLFTAKAKKLIGTFSVYHFNPITINETTAAETVDLFINELDGGGFVLKKSDVTAIKKNNTQFYNLINSNNEEYAVLSTSIYKAALVSIDSILKIIANKKINFNDSDTLASYPFYSETHYSENLKIQAKRIEKNIKNSCLERVTNTDGFEKLTEPEFNAKALEYTKVVVENFQKRVASLLLNTNQLVEASLLNAIALRHDPHSNYFTQEQNKEFNTQLSKQVETFGFYLDEDENGNIVVADIEPGGSAWMSNEINEGDLFIALKIGNTSVSNDGKTAYEIQELLDKATDSKLTLTLKKQNGQLKIVKLIKQKATSQDNTIKGYVLKDKTGNIGYISMPSFYTDMFDQNSPGCANDVAKEILKLEGDSIKGLIIDLRNNGGGSMLEAMNLAGIFVDEGPLLIYKQKNKKPTLLKDVNRGSIFKKPLIVMVNETSASASELFCNIVKDYNLGVVVGQTSYGKGTAQSVLPLDTNVLAMKNGMQNATDFIKITLAKFYRLNCTTHQGNGIVPDVALPPTPGYSYYKESKELFFLSADVITKNVIYTPNPSIDYSSLQQKSKARVDNSKDFKRYKQSADSVLGFLTTTQKIILKYNEFKKYKQTSTKLYNSYESATETTTIDIKCYNTTFDNKITEVNEQTKEFNLKIRESLEDDLFINETFYIMKDLISLTK